MSKAISSQSPTTPIENKTRENSKKHQERSHIVEFTSTRLIIIGSGSINIAHAQSTLSNETWEGLKNTILALASTGKLSGATIIARVRFIMHFLKNNPVPYFTISNISAFYEYCRTRKSQFSIFKRMLLDWHHLGFNGVSDELAEFLSELSDPKRQRPTGSRIRSDNPSEGWYTDQEFDDLLHTIWSDYEKENNSLWNTTACLLSAQYGRRPIQLAQLKIGDLKKEGESFGVSGKRIEFPGVKEKHAEGFRKGKIEVHPIDETLWELCQLQAMASQTIFEEYLGRALTTTEISELPLFHPRQKPLLKRSIAHAQKYSGNSDSFLSSKFLHVSSGMLARDISRWRDTSPVISHRTGKPLVEHSYRYRYTRAKQLARMGIPRSTLQYWLGHESSRSIEAYYDDPAERARILNNDIKPLMAPIAQAFLGALRDKEADAIRGEDPSSRIELDGQEERGVGTCGEHGFCAASVPIPCYRCTKFQPWVYGPHEEVLMRLLERQRQENEIPMAGRGKRLLVPLQLDKDIAAVRLVIELCKKRKLELEA